MCYAVRFEMKKMKNRQEAVQQLPDLRQVRARGQM